MKTFLLILFFSKTVPLTTDPVTISGEMAFQPSETLSAITRGASIQIDVTKMLPQANIEASGIQGAQRLIEERIPAYGTRARLISDDGTEIVLNDYGIALSHEGGWVSLSSRTGVPTDLEFTKVIIESSVELTDVTIYWRNYKH